MQDDTRREFLKKGLAVMGGVAASGVLGSATASSAAQAGEKGPASGGPGAGGNKRPNIVLLITDQQRTAQHWPDGWLEEHMPTMARLRNNGVTFTNNFVAATACCPSF